MVLSLNYDEGINIQLEAITLSKTDSRNNFISHVKQKWTDDWIASEMLSNETFIITETGCVQ